MWELLIKKEIPATNNTMVWQKSEKPTAVAKERQIQKEREMAVAGSKLHIKADYSRGGKRKHDIKGSKF